MNISVASPLAPPCRSDAGRPELTVLISSAGRRVALMTAFRRAAARLGVTVRVLACDLRPDLSSACQFADRAYPVPPVSDPNYVEIVVALCEEEGVGLVVPTIDPELAPLSLARKRLEAMGSYVAVSDPDVIRIAGDKLATAAALDQWGIPSPRSSALADVRAAPASWDWPVIVKPRHGSAGRDVQLAFGIEDFPDIETEPMMVQKRLTGQECTVNLFLDRDGQLRAAVPHCRLAVRAGEVEKGITRRIPALEQIARRLATCLPGARGALCFQAMVSPDGTASVFEINARFGGGYPLADHAGASFAQWLIEERCGLPSTARDEWRSGVTMLRYDDAVFV